MSKVKELVIKWTEKEKSYRVHSECSECGNLYPQLPFASELLKELKQALTEDVAEIERLLDEEIEDLKNRHCNDAGASCDGCKRGASLVDKRLGINKAREIVSKVLK